jgi:hypothetical protein
VDLGIWFLDLGIWNLEFGIWILDLGIWNLDLGIWILDTGICQMLLSFYNNVTDWLGAHMLSCPSKKYLHLECPGCGLQRSVLALMKGDLTGSFLLYPATVPILFLLGFTFLHLKFRFSNGGMVIKYLYAGIAIIVLVFYIYKIVNHKIIA